MSKGTITLRALEKTDGDKVCYVAPARTFSGRWKSEYVREYSEATKTVVLRPGDEGYYVPSNFVIELKNNMEFNLDNEEEFRQWDAIKDSPCITVDMKNMFGSTNADFEKNKPKNGDAIFYVHDENKRQSMIRGSNKNKKAALKYIDDDSSENLRLRLRLLGIESSNMSIDEAEEVMMENAVKNPTKIIDIYTDETKKHKIVYFKALDKGVFQINGNSVFYGDRNLGSPTNAQALISDDKVFREKIIKESF